MNDALTNQLLSGQSVGATVQVVIDALFARIRSEEYPTDTRLPSERTLDVLENRDIIRRRAGSGSFVTYRSAPDRDDTDSTVAERTSPLDHLVMRGILEPEMVRLAVINMTPRDLEDLSKTITHIESVRTEISDFVRYEEELYRKIAQGTRNPLLASCYDLVIDACQQSFRAPLMRRHLTPKRIQDYQQRYNTLFNAIAARDVEAAVEFIKLHLVEEQKLLLQDG